MTNMIDPEGRKRDKATGQPVQYLAAVTGAPVKMTHHVDAYMVLNVAIRSHQENPGAAHGVVGGITMQMYDGFFGSPMYADWMDKTLNEEFLNLGYKINNVSALIDSAEAQGYDLTTKKMKPIITRLLGFQAKGRKMLSDLPKQGITGNQFQINGGATINSTQLNEDKTIKEFGYLESQRFEATNIKAKHVSSKSKPIGRRLYPRPNGANEAEVERRIISEAEKKESIKNQLEKTSQVKRVGNYDSKLAKFNVNDKVVFYNTDNTAQLNGAIVQLAAANSVEEGINYVVRADSGKQYMVPQNKISKA